jgi:hypothetical protein
MDDLLTARGEALAKLDLVYAEAWDAWERSKAQGAPDPGHLQTAARCVEIRCQLLGLFAPEPGRTRLDMAN